MTTTIAYIEQKFPGLTTTFIYREVFALRKLGFDVVTFSIHSPRIDELSQEARPLVESTYYIDQAPRLAILGAHLGFLMDRPRVYLRTLWFVLTRVRGSLDDRRRTLLHFLGAVYFAKISQERNVQHVHAHFAVLSATIAMIIARLLGISFSFTAHNHCFWERILLPEKLREARFVLAISEYTRTFLMEQIPTQPEVHRKIRIVRCGVPVEAFAPAERREAAGTPPVLVSVAQLAEHKGMAYLVQACRLLKQRHVPFLCRIAGSGPQEQQLRQLVDEYDLSGEVKLIGRIFQEEIHALLGQADVFALACIHGDNGKVDGIPVSLMEAMASGIPCVSTTVSGIPDLIDHDVNGLLVAERDADALADALQQLLEDPERRHRMGQAARRKVVAEFNLDLTAPQIAQWIQSEIQLNNQRKGASL